jgi:hypothetical protein
VHAPRQARWRPHLRRGLRRTPQPQGPGQVTVRGLRGHRLQLAGQAGRLAHRR